MIERIRVTSIVGYRVLNSIVRDFMCGICGVVDLDNAEPIEQRQLNSMCELIEHRGPDGTRTHLGQHVALGHTRLSVIDTETGWQPISSEDETIQVILNGEIYNFQLLRAELEGRGHRFKTQSDTEVIVHLYEESGTDCIPLLEGMFALAIWDSTRNKLTLARDRLGKKPLYYSRRNERFVFASESKVIASESGFRNQLNDRALGSYLTYGYVADPDSIYKEVSKLSPAHVLTFDRSGVKVNKYWEPDWKVDSSLSRSDAIDKTRSLVDESVKSRLVSDVPLGFFLSGGVDSSVIVGSAAQYSSNPLKTFSIGFAEETFSELEHARGIADRFGTEHEEFMVTADMIYDLEDIVSFADEPLADPSMFPTYYLSRQTRNHVTVALSGDGGDEVFGGYERYFGLKYASAYHRVPGLLRKHLVANLTNRIPELTGRRSTVRRIKRLTYPATRSVGDWYIGWMQQFRSETHSEMFTESFRRRLSSAQWKDHMAGEWDSSKIVSNTTRARSTDIKTYLPGDLLVKADRMSMAHGLEVRSPFLDRKLVEFAARVPHQHLIRGRQGKMVLKEAYSDLLPGSILNRNKAGFTVPVGEWLIGPLRGRMHDLLLSSESGVHSLVKPSSISRMIDEQINRKQNHAIRLWNLIVLETWAQKFGIALG